MDGQHLSLELEDSFAPSTFYVLPTSKQSGSALILHGGSEDESRDLILQVTPFTLCARSLRLPLLLVTSRSGAASRTRRWPETCDLGAVVVLPVFGHADGP